MVGRLEPINWALPMAVLSLCAALGVLAGTDPRLAVFAALGAAFVLLTFSDLTTGLVILIVVVFAETTPIAGPVLSFTKLTGVLLAAAWVARVTTGPADREQLLFASHPAIAYLLAAFLAWIAMSGIWARDGALAVTHGSRFLLLVVLYVIVFTAVKTRRQAFWVIGAFVTAAAGSAVYGLVLRPTVDSTDAGRLISTIRDPNFLAANLVAGLALAGAGFAAARNSPLIRVGAGAAALICLMAFFLTGSRGGVVAFAVALVAAIVLAGRWRAKAVVLSVLLGLAAFTYYTVYAPPEVRDRLEAATQGEVGRQEGRVTIWATGWRMAEDNPVIGVGAGNFPVRSTEYVLEPGAAYRTDRVIDNPTVAHNTYLGVLAELGLIGFTMFMAIVGFSVAATLAAARTAGRRGDWQLDLLARGLAVAQFGVLAAGFFISAEVSKLVWPLLALGPALLAVARSSETEPVER